MHDVLLTHTCMYFNLALNMDALNLVMICYGPELGLALDPVKYPIPCRPGIAPQYSKGI